MHVSNKNHSGPFTELSYNSSDNMPQMLLTSIKSNHYRQHCAQRKSAGI